MTTTYPVSKQNTAVFSALNEAMRENTAYVYGEFNLHQKFSDISRMHVDVMCIINTYKPCSMSQIAKNFNLTLGSVTQLIDKLIEKGYVERIRSETDRRMVFAELTSKGKQVVSFAQRQVDHIAETVLSKLSKTEQLQFLSLFHKMVQS